MGFFAGRVFAPTIDDELLVDTALLLGQDIFLEMHAKAMARNEDQLFGFSKGIEALLRPFAFITHLRVFE